MEVFYAIEVLEKKKEILEVIHRDLLALEAEGKDVTEALKDNTSKATSIINALRILNKECTIYQT